MTDADRNVRTLIISFVIAIMALVPLRFYEVGQQMSTWRAADVQVLGEMSNEEVPTVTPEVKKSVLEAPWDEIDGQSLR